MYKLLCDFTFSSLIFLATASGAACSLANAKTDNSANFSGDQTSLVENQNATDTPPQKSLQTKAAMPVTPASVAGTYTLNTIKKGVGNDNSLDVENKGNGKLGIFLSGSSIYKNGDVESAHEDEAEGEAQLKNNVAVGNLNQDDRHCRITVTFKADQATVKIASGCLFSVALDGVYKKEKVKPGKKAATENSNLREVPYDKLDDFTNDFENHRPGERYTIVDIPAYKIDKNSRADEFGNSSYKGLYYLQLNDEDNAVGSAFLTSATMVKSLDADGNEDKPVSLRATAVLVESTGNFDVYRMSFITKIEGLNADGSVKWTAAGAEPAKVKFTH